MFFTTVVFLTLSTLATEKVFEATEAPQLTDAHKRVKCQMSRDYTCEGRYNDFSATKKIVSSREYCVDWCEQQLMFDSSMFMNDQTGCCEFWQEKSMCLYFEYGKALKLNNKGSGKGYSAGNCGKHELPEYCVEEEASCCIATAETEGLLGYGHCQKCCHGTCGQKWPWEPATCQRNFSLKSEEEIEQKAEEMEAAEKVEAETEEEDTKTKVEKDDGTKTEEEEPEQMEPETVEDTKTGEEETQETDVTETGEEADETETGEETDFELEDTTKTGEEETHEVDVTETGEEETQEADLETEDDTEETGEEEKAADEEETDFEMDDDTKETGEETEAAEEEETDFEMVPPPQSDLGFFRNLRGLANHMTA